VRPRLFYDLVATGLLAAPTLLWDRHLHNGLPEEHARRGPAGNRVGNLPIRVWSPFGESLNGPFAAVGMARTSNRTWAMDLGFFRSTAIGRPDRLFAGGDSGRDWPLLVDAIRDLPLDVHLVTSQAPAALPPHVRVEKHLSLCRFRDAMAAAAVTAIPMMDPRLVAGLTVLTMAMALGVAVVATHNIWIAEYVTDAAYARNFVPHLSPTPLRLVAALAGVRPPPEEDFDYCELGSGKGDTLALLAAASPRARFVGIDFNPEHIAFADALAAQGGLTNVRFLERDFEALAKASGMPLRLLDWSRK